MGFLGRCCQSTAEDANTVLDLSALEEHTPTLLTQSVKQSGELTNDDKGRSTNSSIDDMMQQASRSTVLPSGSPDDESVDVGLDRFFGTWVGVDGTIIGQIEGTLMTWNGDFPPSEVRLGSSGELLVEVDGKIYKASFENDALHFNDGDVWTKAVPAKHVA